MQTGTVSELLVAVGTLVLAAVAVFQETIRSWFYKPKFQVSIKTQPPDCVAIPFTRQDGAFVANSAYLRLWVQNVGNATARNVEVYAYELRRKRAEGKWEQMASFPPMNLRWANLAGKIYFPSISPDMGKHCDLGHITDPARRQMVNEDSPILNLTNTQTSFAFDLMVIPNNRTHIIGPGEYQLDILVAAENSRPLKRTVLISIRGTWDADETRMLRDGVGVSVLE